MPGISLLIALLFCTLSPLKAQTPATTNAVTPVVAQATLPEPAITRLQALSPTSFLLQWAVAGTGAESFRVYRDNQLIATLPVETREYRNGELKPATVYTYSVATVVGDKEIRSRPIADTTRVPNMTTRETRANYEVVVAGATPGGISAAITLAKRGHKVALVSPSPWLGGMMTGGLSRTDFGSMQSAGGLFKEFVDHVYRYYVTTYGADSPQAKASRTGYYFEPRVAKWVFHELLAQEPNITVMLDHHTRDVQKEGNRVTALYVLDRPRMMRKTLTARVFIDATYEGDMAAQAGAAYRIGREDKAEFDEEHAGELFWDPVKQRVVFGSGVGDRKVQAYNFRLTLTTRPDNLKPFPVPSQYDRERYITLIPDINSGRVKNMQQLLSILPLPGDKFDANNHPLGNPSTDLIGGADAYPEADLWQREPMAEKHRQHILGLLYFAQNDAEVSEAFRKDALRWGFAQNEFVDNDGFPTQLYVREGRRILGRETFTENEARSRSPLRRPDAHKDSIAIADYPIDSHATSPEKDGLLEGFFYLPGTQTQPSQVPYGVMLPLGLEGVIVSICVSSTHIGYGTLRMEPVFMALGTASGVAAHLALTENKLPSQIDVDALQRQLLGQKHVICMFKDVPLDHPHWAALQYQGTKGFFPEYSARPDDNITRSEAIRWLWLWLQLQKPDLQPMLAAANDYRDLKPDNRAFVAAHSLRHWKVIEGATDFDGDGPLSAQTANAWLAAALKLLGRTDAVKVEIIGATLSRGAFANSLYQAGSLPLK